MSIVELRVPQLGEGLREVRILRLFKAPGDSVAEDERLYEVETDKATMEIESLHAGRLVEWLVAPDALVPVGALVARIELAPADVDRSLAARQAGTAAPPDALTRPLPMRQRALNVHLRRSADQIIPASISQELDWGRVRRALAVLSDQNRNLTISELQVVAFCVAQAARQHPRFRSVLADAESLREFPHLDLGIAIELPGDELTTAVIHQADTLSFPELVQAAQSALQSALSGAASQASSSTQLLLTYMGDLGVHQATPVLVAPAAAVLFVGAPFERGEHLRANLTLTFDHRFINGAGAARFLSDVMGQLALVLREGEAPTPLLPERRPASTSLGMEALLRSCLAALLEIPAERIPAEEPFGLLGLTSRKTLELHRRLEEELGGSLPLPTIWDHPNLRALAGYLADRSLPSPAPQVEGARPSGEPEPIAVVGIGCRFPGGVHSPEEFWELLAQGVDALSDQPRDRWDFEAYYDPNRDAPGKIYVREGGFIQDVDKFDNLFFGIAPREALQMDPQQRLALELAWEALEDAGIPPDTLRESATGVFLGACWNDYSALKHKAGPRVIEQHTATGDHFSIISNRISFFLGLHGPSMTLDTACSSSLTAVHLACQSLRQQESTLALAGGVNLILAPDSSVAMARLGAMAPDARCKAFDHRANGYIRGEGGGIVVLKPLSRALRDGDRIYAVIRGTRVNQDGASSFLTAPSGSAQRQILRSALQQARVQPADIDYVEAHGTGTAVGDPIEAHALGEVLSEGRSADRPCLIGSLKTNIGHTEAAAGVAGLIKVALSLQHRQIPASLHFEKPNPAIDMKALKLAVPVRLTPWPRRSGRRLAGVSSFGFGGTNAHAVLEEAPEHPERPGALERTHHVLCLSARSEEALRQLSDKYLRHLEAHPRTPLADICYSANTGRQRLEHRLAVVARDANEARERLAAFRAGAPVGDLWTGVASASAQPKIAFLFTGQGSQYPDMARALFDTAPVFREAMNRCDALLRPLLGRSLIEIIYPKPGAASPLDETAFTQPALFSIEYSMACLWRSWGIEPDFVMGHSLGEYAAACIAGLISLEDGLTLVAHRGRRMQEHVAQGEMAMVYGDEQRVKEALASVAGRASIAAINGPESLVLSGRAGEIQPILSSLAALGIESRLLRISYPGHSHLMDPMLEAFAEVARRVSYSWAKRGFVSNVSGELLGDEPLSAEYFCRHLRETVRFADGMRTLGRQGVNVFIEMGPKPTLIGMGPQTLPSPELSWLPSLRPDQPEWWQILTSLAQLEVRGAKVDWAGLDRSFARHRVSLPTMAFQRRRFWIEAPAPEAAAPLAQPGVHPLLGRRLPLAGSRELRFEARLDAEMVALLSQHRLRDRSLMPGTAFLETALAAGRVAFGGARCGLRDVTYLQALFLSERSCPTLQVVVSPPESRSATFQIYSREAETAEWVLHCEGTLVAGMGDEAWPGPGLEECRARCVQPGALEAHERGLRAREITPGPEFRNLRRFFLGQDEVLSEIELSPELAADGRWERFHPALLDSCLQSIVSVAPPGAIDAEIAVGIAALTIRAPVGSRVICHARRQPDSAAGEPSRRYDFHLFSEEGTPLASASGLLMERLPNSASWQGATAASGWVYAPSWRAESGTAPEPRQAGEAGQWLLFADGQGRALELAELLGQQGDRCVLVHPGQEFRELRPGVFSVSAAERTHFDQLLERLRSEAQPLRGVAHLWALEGVEARGEPDLEALQAATERGCRSTLNLVQALLSARMVSPPELWLVTAGAQVVGASDEAVAPAHAALWGLGRAIATEHPEFRAVLVDLDSSQPERSVRQLFEEMLRTRSGTEGQLAFRQGQRHVARLARLPAASAHPLSLRPDATYLITGGLGGIGLETARRMVERGARHLLLVGRGQGSEEARAEIEVLRREGAEIATWKADIRQAEQVSALLRRIEAELPPLRGVIHAAGVFDDRLLHEHRWELFEKVFAPKLDGAWNLHVLTRELPLDFFILYSSIASVLGMAGLGNYVAANAFLDGLARYRARLGLPALSVSWGVWAQTGMARRVGAQREEQWHAHGLKPMDPASALDGLDWIPADQPHACVVRIDWEDYLRQFPAGSEPALLRELAARSAPVTESARPASRRLAEQLAASSPTEARDLIAGYLRAQIARTLRMDAQELEAQVPLTRFGLDSLMAVELRNKVRSELGVEVSLLTFLAGASLEEIVNRLLSASGAASHVPVPTPVKPEQARELLANMDQLSDADVERLIGDLSREVEASK